MQAVAGSKTLASTRPFLRVRSPCSYKSRTSTRSLTRPAAAGTGAVPITVKFTDEGTEATAVAGQTFVEVADSVGVSIVTGCSQGSCGTCEVEVTKYDQQGNKLDTVVVRACIAKVSDLHPRLDVSTAMEDSIWGVDGYDT